MDQDDRSVWQRFGSDPRTTENATIRSSDQDRAVAQDLISQAYAEGRLDLAEHEERSRSVATSKTLGQLVAPLSDLAPATRTTAEVGVRQQATVHYTQARQEALAYFIAPTLVCWVIWVMTSFGDGGFEPYWPWPVFVTVGCSVHLIQVMLRKQAIIASQTARLERGEGNREISARDAGR